MEDCSIVRVQQLQMLYRRRCCMLSLTLYTQYEMARPSITQFYVLVYCYNGTDMAAGKLWRCRPTNLEQSAARPTDTCTSATNILRRCWGHMCFDKATALCDILYKRLTVTSACDLFPRVCQCRKYYSNVQTDRLHREVRVVGIEKWRTSDDDNTAIAWMVASVVNKLWGAIDAWPPLPITCQHCALLLLLVLLLLLLVLLLTIS